mmetsp:Transcript_14645/g.22755  ORF Transcript_14645/g.22755 Transcript_14645/m.22755 type:complete len:146 (-) Transcript_14645:433-870(-)
MPRGIAALGSLALGLSALALAFSALNPATPRPSELLIDHTLDDWEPPLMPERTMTDAAKDRLGIVDEMVGSWDEPAEMTLDYNVDSEGLAVVSFTSQRLSSVPPQILHLTLVRRVLHSSASQFRSFSELLRYSVPQLLRLGLDCL